MNKNRGALEGSLAHCLVVGVVQVGDPSLVQKATGGLALTGRWNSTDVVVAQWYV